MKDELSVMARLELVVPDGAGEDLLKAANGDAWECGPFVVRRSSHCCNPAALGRYDIVPTACDDKMCQPVRVQGAIAFRFCGLVCSIVATRETSAGSC